MIQAADTAERWPMSVAQLAARCDVCVQTVVRWIRKGCVVRPGDGRRIVYRLDARKTGGRWRISREAWAAFDAVCNARPVGLAVEAARRLTARDQRRMDRSHRRAKAELVAMGLMTAAEAQGPQNTV